MAQFIRKDRNGVFVFATDEGRLFTMTLDELMHFSYLSEIIVDEFLDKPEKVCYTEVGLQGYINSYNTSNSTNTIDWSNHHPLRDDIF